MARRDLELVHQLPGDFNGVYETLLDFTRFGKLHPYIQVVKIIEDRSPQYIEYSVEEELMLFGVIRNKPQYTARVFEIEKNSQIRYTSPVKPNIYLTIDLLVKENDAGSVTVREQIHVESHWLLARVFLRILKDAHYKFFEKLREQMLPQPQSIKI
jgi:hypothetical protein